MKNKREGFTLIELLVVIAIIGLLSSVVFASLTSARQKARNAKRQAEMAEIMKALHLFYDDNECLPRPGSSACAGAVTDSNAGGWDYSSQGSFLPFLKNAGYFSTVPVDPVNNMPGDGGPAGTYSYRYYCYLPTDPNAGLHLGYWNEDRSYVNKGTNGGSWGNPDFLCK